jgi:4-hydroxybenzoate polyprenyltransferase
MRAIPAGQLTLKQVGLFTLGSLVVFEIAAYEINPLCFALSPAAIIAILGYSFTKRFTALSHIVLGLAIGIAPVGAWLAITGQFHLVPVLLGATVMFWIGGFDIIYALQDTDFDRASGLHSLPQSMGKSRALWISRIMHLTMVMLLLAVGYFAHLHTLYFLGVAVVAGLITYEHSIVSPDDLSRVNVAFFNLNGWVSLALFGFVILDRLVLR